MLPYFPLNHNAGIVIVGQLYGKTTMASASPSPSALCCDVCVFALIQKDFLRDVDDELSQGNFVGVLKRGVRPAEGSLRLRKNNLRNAVQPIFYKSKMVDKQPL